MHETQVQSLSLEDPLEKGMATHSIIIAWKIPRTEEPGGLQSVGWQRVRPEWATNTFTLSLSMCCPTPFSTLCLGLSAHCRASKLLVTWKPAHWFHLFSVLKRSRVAGLGLRSASPCTVQGTQHTCTPPATTNSAASYPHALHIQALLQCLHFCLYASFPNLFCIYNVFHLPSSQLTFSFHLKWEVQQTS